MSRRPPGNAFIILTIRLILLLAVLHIVASPKAGVEIIIKLLAIVLIKAYIC